MQRADMHRMWALGRAHGTTCPVGLGSEGWTSPRDKLRSAWGCLLSGRPPAGRGFRGRSGLFSKEMGRVSGEGDDWAEACGVATGQDGVGRTGEAGFPRRRDGWVWDRHCSPGPGAGAGGAPLPRCHSPRQRCRSRSFFSSCCTACFRCRRAWRPRFPSRHRRRAASAICSCRASSLSRLLSGSWARTQ